MRAIAASPGDCFVRDEPRIPAAPEIYGLTSFSGPSIDVALVLVWHAHCQPIKANIALVGEMEYVLVAIVYEPFAVYGFVMAYCNVSFDARVVANIILGDGNGLDPMDHVLENEYLPSSVATWKGPHGSRGGLEPMFRKNDPAGESARATSDAHFGSIRDTRRALCGHRMFCIRFPGCTEAT